jgi:hypothetical protein
MTALPRRTGFASIAALAGLAVTLGLVHAAAPEWARAAGLDVWNLRSEQVAFRQATGEREELELTHDQMLRQIEASEAVAARLIAGRLALPAAADELGQINRARPSFAAGLALTFPDAPTPRHHLARYAIGKVRYRLAGDPSHLAEVTARLEAQYQDMLAAR